MKKLLVLYIPEEDIERFVINTMNAVAGLSKNKENELYNKVECGVWSYEYLFETKKKGDKFPLMIREMRKEEAIALMHAFYAVKSDDPEVKQNAIEELSEVFYND